ncbi:hypothetical protein DMI62_21630 [Escherichia coli]|nr:hypothetical protein [Escherichia coli]
MAEPSTITVSSVAGAAKAAEGNSASMQPARSDGLMMVDVDYPVKLCRKHLKSLGLCWRQAHAEAG